MITVTVAGDPEAAARTAAERIAVAIREAREERGVAHVALAGGRTPARTYRLLARLEHDWSDVHLWFGDERCVPLDDAESNHALLARTLLAAPLHVPPTVHPLQGADADPIAAAAAYERELGETIAGDPPRFDFALLGLGEDGHTASLFPDDPALDEHERLCVAVRGSQAAVRARHAHAADPARGAQAGDPRRGHGQGVGGRGDARRSERARASEPAVRRRRRADRGPRRRAGAGTAKQVRALTQLRALPFSGFADPPSVTD